MAGLLVPTRRQAVPRMPVYRQIMADIRAAIARGELNPGDKLRTIEELAAAYGCSTTPVRVALMRLDVEGVIETRQGVGSFVPGPGQPT